jgi:copper chaperone
MNEVRPSSVLLRIEGMTCEGCVRAVREALGRVPGVQGIEVGLEGGKIGWARLRMPAPLDPASLAEAVEEAGFTLRAVIPAEAE